MVRRATPVPVLPEKTSPLRQAAVILNTSLDVFERGVMAAARTTMLGAGLMYLLDPPAARDEEHSSVTRSSMPAIKPGTPMKPRAATWKTRGGCGARQLWVAESDRRIDTPNAADRDPSADNRHHHDEKRSGDEYEGIASRHAVEQRGIKARKAVGGTQSDNQPKPRDDQWLDE